jgi:hypothetical protein
VRACESGASCGRRRRQARVLILKSWKQVNEAIDGYAASLKGTKLEAI